jgi:hypothetical protein
MPYMHKDKSVNILEDNMRKYLHDFSGREDYLNNIPDVP